MFLSELEISGFKSFAGKTKFKFADGITAIVGPNGCGKSNVVDAVRWVLGEQKTSVLRSDSMDSVIFNGTSKRKPLGMAEVTMRLENNKGVLPSEYDTIQISRRLFRDGNSNYLLNKTKCRLKDINDLFMDTGLGPDSYSVIELKMVEALINGKMDERRKMIEEAAGVTRYKQRRKEAGNKLNKVQEDLERINDILSEVEVNVRRLSRQAKKTKKYNELSEQLKEIETSLLKNEYASFGSKNSDVRTNLNELEKQINDLESLLEESDKELSKTREVKSEVDAELSQLMSAENVLNNQISESKRLISVSNEKLTSLDQTNSRLKNENERSKETIESLESEVEELTVKLKKREEDSNTQKESLNELKELKNKYKKELDEARELANADIEILNKLNNQIQSAYSIIENNESRFSKIDKKIDNYNDEISINNTEIQKKEQIVSEFEAKVSSITKDLKDKTEELEIVNSKLEQFNSDISNLNQNISDIRNNISSKKSQVEFLEALTADDNTTQMLINSNDWDKPDNTFLLEELISSEDQYAKAVSSVLGEFRSLLVVDTAKQAESAFQLLENKNLSKRSIVCKELIPNSKGESKLKNKSLTEVIDCDDKIKDLVNYLFGNIAIVDTKEEAYNVVGKGADSAVTLDGFIVNKNGILRGGGTSKKDTAKLGKQKRIKELNKSISDLEDKLEKANAEKNELSDKRNNLNPNKVKSEIKRLENELKQAENTKMQSSMKIDSLKNNIEMYKKSIESSRKESDELSNENKQLNEKIADNKRKLTSAEANKEEKLNNLAAAEKKYSKSNEEMQAAEILNIRIASDYKNIKNEIDRNKNQISTEKHRLENRKNQIIENEQSKSDLKEGIDQQKKLLDENEAKLIQTKNEREQKEDKRKNIEENQLNLTNEINQNRNNYTKLRDKFHKEDIVRSELETKMEALENRAFEAYDLKLNELDLQLDESFPIQERKHEVSELKKRLVNLGNINFEAVQEYDEQNERLIFLSKQIKDLTESETTLKETIKEINNTAEERFSETFKKIKENFSALFKKLFNDEGVADINLVGDNLLESNVEITAKPPGKKPRSIDMLSGGEKTLTAIALLFAIYLVKPSPFCILDEVDAPLDDANLKRFNKLIREFSKNTQFIIVTHMKITMEEADTLYGITQQEVGISKIVSVKLRKEEENNL